MEPTSIPDNGRQSRGLARFWPVHGTPAPVQRQSDEDAEAEDAPEAETTEGTGRTSEQPQVNGYSVPASQSGSAQAAAAARLTAGLLSDTQMVALGSRRGFDGTPNAGRGWAPQGGFPAADSERGRNTDPSPRHGGAPVPSGLPPMAGQPLPVSRSPFGRGAESPVADESRSPFARGAGSPVPDRPRSPFGTPASPESSPFGPVAGPFAPSAGSSSRFGPSDESGPEDGVEAIPLGAAAAPEVPAPRGAASVPVGRRRSLDDDETGTDTSAADEQQRADRQAARGGRGPADDARIAKEDDARIAEQSVADGRTRADERSPADGRGHGDVTVTDREPGDSARPEAEAGDRTAQAEAADGSDAGAHGRPESLAGAAASGTADRNGKASIGTEADGRGEGDRRSEGVNGRADSRTTGSPSAGSPSAGSPSAGSPSAGSPSAGSPSAGRPATGWASVPTSGIPTISGQSGTMSGLPTAGAPVGGEEAAAGQTDETAAAADRPGLSAEEEASVARAWGARRSLNPEREAAVAKAWAARRSLKVAEVTDEDAGASAPSPRRSLSLEDADAPMPRAGRRAAREEATPGEHATEVPLRPGDVTLGQITFWDEEAINHFRAQWHEVKAEFVDDPVTALTRAHDLLTEAVNELTEAMLAERDELDPLDGRANPDTESMRMAMRGYREFLDRILAL